MKRITRSLILAFRTSHRAGRSLAVAAALVLGVLLLLASPTRAQSPETIIRISGNGAIGTLDPLNQSSVDGGATWQQAHIIAKHPAYGLIAGTKYIYCGPSAGSPTFLVDLCGINKTTRYRTTFTLPAGFSSPSLSVDVHADNAAKVLLNGVSIGQQPCFGTGTAATCPQSNFQDPADTFSTSNSSLFQVGSNTLEFHLYDVGGVAGLDYKATVSFVPPEPFAAFDAKVEITLGPGADDDAFEVKAPFTLGTGSDGIAPLTELVQLELTGGTGSFSTTIPAGSFEFQPAKFNKKGKQVKPRQFKFEGVIDGVTLEAKITDLGNDNFEFKAEGTGADLTGFANPVTVTLTIGDDAGSDTVEAEFE